METVSTWKSWEGTQGVYRHRSSATGTDMVFAVYVPPRAKGARLPVLWWLSGLTCTHANVMEKGEYRRACAEHGIVFVAPDTSPRGEGVPDEDRFDLGQGAGFYVDATEAPWAGHFRMRTYVEEELPALVAELFPVDMARQAISGHSMGGHGALTVALRNPGRFRSVSAFSPIVSTLAAPWGEAALSRYLGEDRERWREYDSYALIAGGARLGHLLVEQGMDDEWLEAQLKTGLLRDVCKEAGQELVLNFRPGYDHSYYFVSTFMEGHIGWHAERLRA